MNKKGFTLAETLVTISIVAIISVVLVTFYIVGLRIYKEKTMERDLIFSTQNTLKEISDDIKSSTAFIQTKNLNGSIYTSDQDTIILEIPSINNENKTIYTNGEIQDYDYIVYNLNTNKIIKNVYPDTDSNRELLENKIIEGDVTAFAITYYPNNPPTDWAAITKINTQITARKSFGNISKQIQLGQIIKSRNQ